MGELYETNYLNKASIMFFREKKKQAWWLTFVKLCSGVGRQEHQKFKIITACTSRSKPGRVNMKTVSVFMF